MRARLTQAVDSARARLAGEPVRWVRVDRLHLTLRFIGEIPLPELDRILLSATASRHAWRAFGLRMRGLGCFPDVRRPRVLWAGAEDQSGVLATLVGDLEQIAREHGLPAETRPFTPHLTIGRVKDRMSPDGTGRLSSWIQEHEGEDFGMVAVESIELYRSDLRPEGPTYTRLAALALGS